MAVASKPGIDHAFLGPDSDLLELQLYDEILQLRDAVLQGTQTDFRLSTADLQALRDASRPAITDREQSRFRNAATFTRPVNGSIPTSTAWASAHPIPVDTAATSGHSSALSAYASKAQDAGSSHRESDNAYDGVGLSARQLIEKRLKTQVDKRRVRHGKEQVTEAYQLNVDDILRTALARVPHESGLPIERTRDRSKSSSFDTNDYYSSRAPSEVSSREEGEADESRVADVLAGPFAGDKIMSKREAANFSHVSNSLPHHQDVDMVLSGDEEDDYVPPEPEALIHLPGPSKADNIDQSAIVLPQDTDDESEYEPGEVSQDSIAATPSFAVKDPSATQLYHGPVPQIAAPQPSRISSLVMPPVNSVSVVTATQTKRKRADKQPMQAHALIQDTPRASSASPAANGNPASGKKKRNKKRKRDVVGAPVPAITKKSKKTGNNSFALATPLQLEPRIKEEPVSPPPFEALHLPVQVSRRRGPLPGKSLSTPANMATNVNNAVSTFAKPMTRADSSSSQDHPSQRPYPRRDTLDLRRIATMQSGQQPPSWGPLLQPYSPRAPAAGFASDLEYNPSRPLLTPLTGTAQLSQYQDAHAYALPGRGRSVSDQLPLPPQPDTDVFVDEFGRRYYRESAKPATFESSMMLQRLPSWNQPYLHFKQHAPPSYGGSDFAAGYGSHPPALSQGARQYVDLSTPALRSAPLHDMYRLPESGSGAHAPWYQPTMPAPMPPNRLLDHGYALNGDVSNASTDGRRTALPERQANIAAQQYFRSDLPPSSARAMSVLPQLPYQAHDFNAPPAPMPPTNVQRFVDRYGREVYSEDVRQIGHYQYPQ